MVGADETLQSFGEVAGLTSTLQGKHELESFGLTLWTWEAPPWFLRDLHERLGEQKGPGKGLMSSRFYRPRLQDLLTSIRFAYSPFSNREVRFAELLSSSTRSKFAERQEGKDDDLCLRLGLFSLRGPFETAFFHNRALAVGIHGFLAASFGPKEPYFARLKQILEVASDPERGVDLLVLPELSVDEEALEWLKSRLGQLAERSDRRAPLLTVAGSFHFQSEGGAWLNLCTVLDHTGRVAWTQAKNIPYPYRGIFKGAPKSAQKTDISVEDIEPAQDLWLVPSPLGWLAVAICSDLVPFSTGGPSALLSLPVDWVFVPSMSAVTDPFLEVGRELARTGKIVCFANAASAVPPPNPRSPAPPERPPGILKMSMPAVSAFINLPSLRACGLWFDGDDPPLAKELRLPSIPQVRGKGWLWIFSISGSLTRP